MEADRVRAQSCGGGRAEGQTYLWDRGASRRRTPPTLRPSRRPVGEEELARPCSGRTPSRALAAPHLEKKQARREQSHEALQGDVQASDGIGHGHTPRLDRGQHPRAGREAQAEALSYVVRWLLVPPIIM